MHPSLRVEPFDAGFSHGCSLGTDDRDCPVPYIDVGIGSGMVSFSYSADPKVAFAEALRAIAIFERHGYTAYDPQTDSLISAKAGAAHGQASFVATRDAVVRQMQERGETVLGFPERKRIAPQYVVGLVLFVIVAVTLLVVRHYYVGERSPELTQRLREAQERLHPSKQTSRDAPK